MLLLHYCVSRVNLAKNIFVCHLQRFLANFMQILGLWCTIQIHYSIAFAYQATIIRCSGGVLLSFL